MKIKISQGVGQNNFVAMAKCPNKIGIADLEHRICQCSGFVKMMTGVANNAALMVMAECIDKIADKRWEGSYAVLPHHPHPAYKGRVKQLFNIVIKERNFYRIALRCPMPGEIRFFCLSDIPEEARKKYGVITDEQYFEFWENTGTYAYTKSIPLIGSLHNKFRLSMLNHNVSEPEIVAWGLVGASVLELAVTIWQRAMRSVYDLCEGVLSMKQIEDIYRPFSLAKVSKVWQRALIELAPETENYELDSTEERNVAMGVEQLEELWVSPDMPFDATIKAVEDYQDEIFSTVGNAKKAIRELSEMRNNAVKELDELMKEKSKQ